MTVTYRAYYDRKLKRIVEIPPDAEHVPQPRVHLVRDTAPYRSPLGTGVIDGKAARREDLKRGGCREVDPSEWKGGVRNHEFAKRWGMQPTGDPIPKGKRLPTRIDENWRE